MRHPRTNIPDYSRVKKYQEYWDFVMWCATPDPLKKPSTQGEFAKQHSIHETQLSRWKAMPEFRQDLVSSVTELMSHKINNIMYSLENRIYKDGGASEVRLYLEWVQKWMPEVKLNIESADTDQSSLIRQLANEFEKKLKEVISKKKNV